MGEVIWEVDMGGGEQGIGRCIVHVLDRGMHRIETQWEGHAAHARRSSGDNHVLMGEAKQYDQHRIEANRRGETDMITKL
jgi:hypothetical protein